MTYWEDQAGLLSDSRSRDVSEIQLTFDCSEPDLPDVGCVCSSNQKISYPDFWHGSDVF